MSTDKEARLLRVIHLLMEGTRDSSLEWDESYKGFQTTLSGQTVVLEKDVPYSVYSHMRDNPQLGSMLKAAMATGVSGAGIAPKTATLEIRGKKGEVLERIENPDPIQPPLGTAFDAQTRRFSSEITQAVDSLYDLVANRKEILADTAIDDLLGALEGRVRAK